MIQLIKILLMTISPHLRGLILESVNAWSVAAEKTPNPWDDIFISILKTLLDIEE